MMSSPAIPVRRRRQVIESDDDEEGDYSRASSKLRTTPSARDRTSGAASENSSQDGSPDTLLPESYRSTTVPNSQYASQNGGSNAGTFAEGEFQPGAIVRVKMSNFVTYEDVEYHPGPNLNMVIGPNGTGKSSLVCAICLGLGYSPKNLGRADQVGEFVKHGQNEAVIETELQRGPKDRQNPVIQLRITRDGDKRKWRLNGRESSLKAVQQLTKNYGIQIDNLCQFLPQDRVSEFAGLTPIELLHETQRAAAPEQMLEWHEQLKQLWKDLKQMRLQFSDVQERLTNLQSRQETLRLEVERIRGRAEIQETIKLMEKAIPFIQYQSARNAHREAKATAKEAKTALRRLETQVAPALEAVNAKQRYLSQLDAAVAEREGLVKLAVLEAESLLKELEDFDQKIRLKDGEKEGESKSIQTQKQEIQSIASRIRDDERRAREPAPEFDPAEWNARIREKEHESRDITRAQHERQQQLISNKQQAQQLLDQARSIQRDQESLESHAGKRLNKLRQRAPETARAWEWIEKNQDKFEKPVLGPPMLTCSVKDSRYLSEVESLLAYGDFCAFTAQTRNDMTTLSNQLYNTMSLGDVHIKTSTGRLDEFQRPFGQDQMQQLGLEHWALDLIDGPEPVLALFASSSKLHMIGVAKRDVSSDQLDQLSSLDCPVASFVAGGTLYKVSRRREYGAVSTQTRQIRPASWWTEEAVDISAQDTLSRELQRLEGERAELARQSKELSDEGREVANQKLRLEAEINELKDQKNQLQKAHGNFLALPEKIARNKADLEKKQKLLDDRRQKLRNIDFEVDAMVLEKAQIVYRHKDQVERIRASHLDHEEALVRQLEAKFDVKALSSRNAGIKQQVDDEKRRYEEAVAAADAKKREAGLALRECQAVMAESPDAQRYYESLDSNKTVEDMQSDIDAEKAKLEFMEPGDPNALNDYEKREAEIARLSRAIEERTGRAEKLEQDLQEIRQLWEPELDKLVQEISDAFSYNFEQIRCAGEVGLSKPEDYDQWAIEIKVKFRQTEQLQLLDQHRQSGGERSVSTIFYLMSLQSLARAPFRVVDEINQGMDPRNERMVHERMVEIACKEHTSQYFLITPKLLTGLRYDQRMKVLCIASGEYMPPDYRQLDVRQVIKMKRALIAAS